MKKKLLLIIICFFAFSSNAFALAKVNRMDVEIAILEDGIAEITEVWQIGPQNNNYFEKNFYDVSKTKITDVSITEESGTSYLYIDKFNKDRNLVYNYQDSGKTKKIRFTTNNKEASLTIKYKVDGIITKYDDVSAINWNILSSTNSLEIGILDVYISGFTEFNENNMALYGIGNNISCEFDKGKIHLFSSNVKSKTKIKIMASLADYEFSHHLVSKGKFQEKYEEFKAKTPIHAYIEEVLDNILIMILIILTIAFLLGFSIYKLIKKDKISADYKNIKPYKRSKVVPSLQESKYVDRIPCEGDLYKTYFIANYYSVIRHRSCLIGTLIFKWILEGIIKIEESDSRFFLRLTENVTFASPLDQNLYNILLSSSSNLILDNNKFTRYVKNNPKEIIDWYDSVVTYAIKDEYLKRNVNVKKNKIYLNKVIYNEAENIQGFKKYLLNFNQVPRETELTEEIYKLSLVSSILLRVDENLYKELLRKNPNNAGALVLEKFSKVKYLYNNVYSIAIEEYKKDKKNKRDKNRYNPVGR